MDALKTQWASHPWRIVAGGLAALVAIVLLVVHLSVVRSRVLAYAIDRLRADVGVDARIDRLSYNLFTLRFEIDGARLAAVDHETPFLEVDALRLDLPWTILGGTLAVESLEIERPRIAIVRRDDGVLNLPAVPAEEPAAPSEPLGPIEIDRLLIRDLGARYADAAAALDVDGRGVTLDLSRTPGPALMGRLTMSEGLRLRMEDRETSVSTLEGALVFDGSNLTIDELRVVAPEGQLRMEGRLDLLSGEQRVDAKYEGSLDLSRLAVWAPGDQVLTGTVRFSGAAIGPLTTPDLSLELSSDAAKYAELPAAALQLQAALSGETLTVERLHVALAGGGEIAGDARVRLGDEGASQTRLRWNELDVGVLARVAAPEQTVRLDAVATGTASLDWTALDVTTATGTLENTLRARAAPANELSVEGHLALALEPGQWRLTLDHEVARSGTVAGQLGGRLDAANVMESGLGGRLTVQTPDFGVLARRVRSAGLDLGLEGADEVAGDATVDVSLAGTFASPSATGELRATGVRAFETGPMDLQVGFAAGTANVEAEHVRLELGSNSVEGEFTFAMETERLTGQLVADLPDLAALAAAVPAAWRPAGTARVEATLGGTLDDLSARGTLSARDVAVAGQSVRALDAEIRLVDRVAVIERLALTQDEGELTLSGRYGYETGRYVVDVAGNGLVVRPLPPAPLPEGTTAGADVAASDPTPLAARFDIRFTGEGSVSDPAGQGFVQFARLSWGDYELGNARADVAVADGTAMVDVRVPALAAQMEMRAALDAPRSYTAKAVIAAVELATIVRSGGPAGEPAPDVEPLVDPASLSGAIAMSASARGSLDDPAGSTVDVDLRLVDVTVAGTPILLDRPARLRYADRVVTAEDFALRVGATTLTAQGRVGAPAGATERLAVRLNGMLGDLVSFARLAPGLEELEASGAIEAAFTAAGALDAPELDGTFSLSSGSVTVGDLPTVTDMSLRGSYKDGLLELGALRAVWQGASLSAEGKLPATVLRDSLPEAYLASLPALPPTGRISARLESITPSMLAPFLDAATIEQMAGRIDAVAELDVASADLLGLAGTVTLNQAAIELARVRVEQRRPTRLRLAEGRLEIVEWAWAGTGTDLNLAGDVQLAGESPELDVRLVGNLDLRMLGAFSRDIATSGRATFDVQAVGALATPAIDGTLALEAGEITIREPRLAITELQGTVALTQNGLVLRNVTASANGGTLEIGGEVQYPEFELAGGSITIAGRGLALEVPANLRSEVDADLTFTLSPDAPALTGKVTVLRGAYREPISLTGQLLSGVEVSTAAPPEPGEPGLVDRIRLSIDVVSAQNLVLDNNYGRLEIGSNLRVVGTPSAPALAGRLVIEEGGEIFLGGQTWRVERGNVDFTSATRIEPNLDLSIVTRVSQFGIRLSGSGTPETLEASLSSIEGGVSQADLVSLLLTGQKATAATAAQTEIARGQLLVLLSGELLGFAGRAVGLDTVQVGRGLGGADSDFDLLASETDPSARLTIAQSISRDVELVFSQSLRESSDITWIAIYRPLRAVEVRGTTRDDQSRSYEFRHELNFGGGVRAGTRSRAEERADQQRVTGVRFTSTPAFDLSDVEGRARLEAGDRFDFYRWQDDRDRLLAYFHERGFLEARVDATRTPTTTPEGETGVLLEYAIERGPATRLTIEGGSLPGDVLERMRETWSRAVFDGFLLEDLEITARRVLVERGSLRAEVGAEVASPGGAEVKEIVVRLTPGPRFDDWRLEFRGQEAVTAEDLTAAVDARGLRIAAWLNRSEFEEGVSQYLRSRGFLSGAVTVETPTFEDRSAVLPVRVTEGPRFQIGRVDVVGVDALPESEVRESFAVTSGQPYDQSMLEPGRRAVEVAYLRQGYNDVRVSVTSLIDRDAARVDVGLAVAEGRQQILQAVSVAGNERTSQSLIERALELDPGQPANLSDSYRAQKRLYDTGVFRRVDINLEPMPGGEPGAAEPVRAAVTLQEMPLYRLRYGFRLNDEIGPAEVGREITPGLVVDLMRLNLFGRAISAGVASQVEADRRLVRGIVATPMLFGLPVRTSLFLTRARQDFTPEGITPFVEDASEATVEQRFRPLPDMAVSYDYRFTRTHSFEIDPDPVLPFDILIDIARVTGTYAWDTRDDPFDARRGWFHSSGIEYAAARLGSDLRFVKYALQQQYFRPLGESVVLASAVRLGTARGLDQELIPSERFFVGGGTSVRGFAEDGLGDTDFFGDPTGGNAAVIFNQEVRFPLYKWVRGVGFFDAGNAFPKASDLSFTDLEVGVGFGVRVNTPFGLVRVDFGVPVTRREREPTGRWYFSLGQAF